MDKHGKRVASTEKDRNSRIATLKKVQTWKNPGHDSVHGYWFKKFPSILDRLAI